jgi:hypothetical protein
MLGFVAVALFFIWIALIAITVSFKYNKVDRFKALCALHGGVVVEGQCVIPIDLPGEKKHEGQ